MFCRRLSGDEFVMFPEEPLVSAETDEDDPGEEIAGCKKMMNREWRLSYKSKISCSRERSLFKMN